ncbi:alpha/beta fold hydrolase [Streptococcus oricebi]|uniref:Alpha/beta hydrolase n=1 Tax=Streptococcus oricebi TaxID=1547447 RepID=A0ABS5B3J1_9STRE|nr:alpha/beta fold hydrolase [Streptococcus oricebi]MBP2623330.1 alpha/beta hydrolase [Streptococcus oricebi]
MDRYTGIEQFDFQILRFTVELKKKYPQVAADLKEIGQAITDFESWYSWWVNKAATYEAADLLEVAATYYRASLFYLAAADERLAACHEKYLACFYRFHKDTSMESYQVPYDGGYLPVIFLKNENAKGTLLVHGGFDSYLEELTSWFLKLYQADFQYNILIFDGPGQGYVAAQGLYLRADFEYAVSTVLDYFHLSAVDAVGISLGGYLVMRAAAFEKRIKRVIAFDIFYDAMDAVAMSAGWSASKVLQGLLKIQQKDLVNRLIESRAKRDINLNWMLTNGYRVSGTRTPFDFISYFQQFQVKDFLPLINQPCLLLAGQDDFYVPVKRLKTIEKGLKNSKLVESRLFTKESGGSLHCQIDQIELAMRAIKEFLIRE